MASDNTGAKSSSAADSYIGSLISLTSKSEIRYEGVLYNINTDESSIGLQNVRSFGTEGRKKDGPQIPASEKVYEYILFRGSDIKDLQVKASPPVQSTPTINNDPAIIQSHYPRPTPTSSSLLSTVSGSPTDISSHSAQVGQHGIGFQGSLPLYPPGGNFGSWGASPQPPMYWQGYYPPPPNGLPQLHQQSLLRPPPGLSMPTSLQQPLQFPNFSSTLPGSSSLQGSSLPEAPSPLLTLSTSSPILVPSSLSTSALPSALSSALPSMLSSALPSMISSALPLSSSLPSIRPSAPSASLASEISPSLSANRAPLASLHTLTQDSSLPHLSLSTTASADSNAALPQISNKSSIVPISLPQTASMSVGPAVGVSASVSQDKPKPSLITPGQLLQSGSTTVSLSPPSQSTDKDVEVVQVSSSSALEQTVPVTTESQPAILPLPAPARPSQKANGPSFHNHNGYRGRGRGRGRGAGRSHQVMKFTEDFDFTAMNEKFNKDEVWGHLGKSSKGDGKDGDEDDYTGEENAELPKIDAKPVYNKDDFFDSLSSNALDRESQNGRPRFSELRKLDTETFGEFSRYRGGRGGRGYARGGHSRGGYGYGGGRGGYGYGGRGLGRGPSNRTS